MHHLRARRGRSCATLTLGHDGWEQDLGITSIASGPAPEIPTDEALEKLRRQDGRPLDEGHLALDRMQARHAQLRIELTAFIVHDIVKVMLEGGQAQRLVE